VLLAELSTATHTEVFSAFGQRGLRSEQVVAQLVKNVRDYLTTGASFGEYLTDQILIPLALAGGGAFCTGTISRHARTNMEVITAFLGTSFGIINDSPLVNRVVVR
jgi:RNA 3'-terminal phosphate cyclase (ATP)